MQFLQVEHDTDLLEHLRELSLSSPVVPLLSALQTRVLIDLVVDELANTQRLLAVDKERHFFGIEVDLATLTDQVGVYTPRNESFEMPRQMKQYFSLMLPVDAIGSSRDKILINCGGYL